MVGRPRPLERRLRGGLHGRHVHGHVRRLRRQRYERRLEGLREGRVRSGQRPQPRGPSPEPRVLRRRALPGADVLLEVDRAERRPPEDRRGDHHQGPHRVRPDHGRDLGADRRPVRRHALRPEARDDDRPREVRRQLEQPTAERRAGPCHRRRPHRRPPAREAGVRAMRVLGISGSLRRESYNTALLRYTGNLIEAEGAEFEIYDALRDIPPFDEDEEAFPPDAVARLRDAIHDADAVFFTTPEYNSSIPGALKNALDWASRPLATNAFRNKTVAVVGASAGAFGAVWAAAELRKVLGAMGARVADAELAVGHAMDKIADGTVVDEDVRRGLRDAFETLLAEAAPVEAAA